MSTEVDSLFAETYRELRKIARSRLSCGRQDTLLNTTGLVHESYLRLAATGLLQLKDRSHFLCYAARAMRSVIVDLVRKRHATRRGGALSRADLTPEIPDQASSQELEIMRVHDALQDLAKVDLRLVQIVEMRYFAGMSESEIAGSLSITDRTVRREWHKARLWLANALA